MRVLLLPANNAPEFQVEAMEHLIRSTGNQVLRWHHSLQEDDYDIAVFIAGEHNKIAIRELYQLYTKDEPIELDEYDDDEFDIYIGKGLHSFASTSKKPCYLLLAPRNSDNADLKDSFRNNKGNRGPAFLKFDRSDITEHNVFNYTMRYAVLRPYYFDDLTAYGFETMIRENGGSCQVMATRAELVLEIPRPETLSLLLLRR